MIMQDTVIFMVDIQWDDEIMKRKEVIRRIHEAIVTCVTVNGIARIFEET